jgi:hypothetical protein
MSFFNKKEEVMEIQLTQYGKYLLSKGKFKPVFYAFSDDEILYDISYGENKVELKEESFERIQENTIRLRSIYEHETAEDRVRKRNEQITTNLRETPRTGLLARIQADGLYGSDNADDNLMTPDNRRIIRNLIGTSDIGNQNAPSWVAKSLNDEIFETPILVSSSGPNIGYRRPQINMIIDYELKSENLDPESFISLTGFTEQDGAENEINFIDGMKLKIKDSNILFEIEEKNVPDNIKNFDIEFFSVDGEEEVTRNGITTREDILSKLYVGGRGIDNPENLSTYLQVLFDNAIAVDEDFDFDTFTIEAIDDEEFCD